MDYTKNCRGVGKPVDEEGRCSVCGRGVARTWRHTALHHYPVRWNESTQRYEYDFSLSARALVDGGIAWTEQKPRAVPGLSPERNDE